MQSLLRTVSRRLIRLCSTDISSVTHINTTIQRSNILNKINEVVKHRTSVSWEDFEREEFPQIMNQCLIGKGPIGDYMNRNFVTLVIQSLISHGQTALLRDFVCQRGLDQLSVPQITLYLRHCGESEEDLSTWQYLVKRNGGTLFDSRSTINLVEFLCRTSQWRESITLIKNLNEIGKTAPRSIHLLVEKLFAGGLDEEAFRWLDKTYSEYSIGPGMECKSALSELNNAEFLLQMAADRFMLFDKELILSPVWEPLFKVNPTVIDVSSRCPVCKTYLLPAKKFTEEEMQTLREAVQARILNKKNNVFLTTTPKEYEHFTKFLKQTGPFDVVIDGLNIGYKNGARAVAEEARRLTATKQKRVLIVGRRHMLKWPNMRLLPSNVLVYTTENVSNDDVYVLLACLCSHADCMMVTSDLFRDHKANLSTVLTNMTNQDGSNFKDLRVVRLFNRWLATHQQLFRSQPLRHDVVAQRDPEGWHLPSLKNRCSVGWRRRSSLSVQRLPSIERQAAKDGYHFGPDSELVYNTEFEKYLNFSAINVTFITIAVGLHVLQELGFDPFVWIVNENRLKSRNVTQPKSLIEKGLESKAQYWVVVGFFSFSAIICAVLNKAIPIRMYYNRSQKTFTFIHVNAFRPFRRKLTAVPAGCAMDSGRNFLNTVIPTTRLPQHISFARMKSPSYLNILFGYQSPESLSQ